MDKQLIVLLPRPQGGACERGNILILHCIVMVWIVLDLWLSQRYLTYHSYNFLISICGFLINPVMFYISPKFGRKTKKKIFLYFYPSMIFLIMIFGPAVFGIFVWRYDKYLEIISKPRSVTDMAYFLICFCIYVATLKYYKNKIGKEH